MCQIKLMLKNLGFMFSLHREDRYKYGWNDLYKIRISGTNMTKNWFYLIKPENPKHIAKFSRIK